MPNQPFVRTTAQLEPDARLAWTIHRGPGRHVEMHGRPIGTDQLDVIVIGRSLTTAALRAAAAELLLHLRFRSRHTSGHPR